MMIDFMDYPAIINESCSIRQISPKELRNIFRNIKKAHLIPRTGEFVMEVDGIRYYEKYLKPIFY